MPLPLSILALVAAAVAIILAVRARRASHRLALEMVQLRDRLAAAEAHRDDALDAAERAVESAARGDPSLTTRIDALEARLRSQAVTAVTVTAPTEETSPEEIVRRHLRREGYTHVTILDTDEDGRLLVEAERDGITRKGRVRIDAKGRMVRWQPVSSLRAFP